MNLLQLLERDYIKNKPMSLKTAQNLYLFWRIQERKYSSNIIEGGNYNKSGKIVWIPIIAPLSKKEEGDKFCLDIFDIITEKE